MKVIHFITILLAIVLLIMLASFLFSTESMNAFFSYLSWAEFVVFSFLITFAFNDQKLIIRVLVFFASIILLGGGYVMLERLFNLNMLFINYIILFLFIAFVILILVSAASPLPINNKKTPKNPIPFIISSRITNKSQLRQFYDEQETENLSFETFVRGALSVARDTLDDDQWKIVSSIIEPIISELEEQQPFSKIDGQEKDTLQQIYRLANQYDNQNRDSIIFQLKSLVDTIYEKNRKLYDEEKRNSQALALSIIGLILTVILSSISICISLFGWSI